MDITKLAVNIPDFLESILESSKGFLLVSECGDVLLALNLTILYLLMEVALQQVKVS